MTKLDAVGTTGGKVTVETKEPNSMRKIRLKVAPKDYKKGPGPTGRDRLQRRVNSLLQAASRLERKELAAFRATDAVWARRLVEALMAFNAQEFVNAQPRVDVQGLLRDAKEAWVCPYCARSFDKTLNDWEREAADHVDACRPVAR